MSWLKPPRLDDRTQDDLRREMVRRIPVHAPEWTDHNPGDPGIALIELFAFLGENLLYRMNRMPEKAHAQFLELLDIPLRAATPARAFVQLRLTGTDGREAIVEHAPQKPRGLIRAGDVAFQLEDELVVLPVEGLVVVRAPVPEPDKVVGVPSLVNLLKDNDIEADPSALGAYVTTTLPEPPPTGLPPATHLEHTVDRTLWIALLRPEDTAPPLLEGETAEAAIRRMIADRVLSVGVRLDDELCGANDHRRCPDPGTSDRRKPLVWQIATGRFRQADGADDVTSPLYRRLVVESDTTDGMARSGVVRLRLPRASAPAGAPQSSAEFLAPPFGTWTPDQLPDPDLMGVGDLPPLLEDADLEARVVTWIRCFRPAPSGDAEPPLAPRVRWVGVNTVAASQAVTARAELLSRGTGRPYQSVTLAHAPVIRDTLVLEVRESSGWVTWKRVDDFGGSRPNDPHYVLERATGEVVFGDGVHGRMPRRDEPIRARTYQYGGGAAGNLPAGELNELGRVPAGLEGSNPLAAEGGFDGETPEKARYRVAEELRHRNRAVAAQDFVDLAFGTPGVDLGRVHVMPRHKPHERVDGVPGVVSLVLVPAWDALHPDEPTPDKELLRRVCEHLEPRRLVTTELYLSPPEYVPVWLSVSFEADKGYGAATVGRWVELAIRQHLAPLPPYGPAGEGWPFGRDVRAADVEAAVLRVEGVRLVNGVLLEGTEIQADGAKREVTVEDEPRVSLEAWQLPVVRGVQIVEGPELPPEPVDRTADPVRPPVDPTTILPVPVEIEVC